MADPYAQTPDQQAATGTPGQPELMSQGGLLDALRSRGTLPSMLAQSMNQAGPGPSGGLAIGSGMLNAASGGNAALNPYLQQQQAQQNEQVKQAMQYQQLQQHKQHMLLQQNELAFKMTQGMVDSGDEQARKEGWKNRQKLGGPLGVNISDSLVDGLGRGKLTKEQMQRVVGMADDGQLPEDIGRVTGLSPRLVQEGLQIAGSDANRRILGIMTKDEAEAGKAKDQQASLEFAQKEWGLTDPKDPRVPFATGYTQREFGVPFHKATSEQKREAVEKAQAVAPPTEKPTAAIKNAMAEFNPNGNINNRADVETAMRLKRGKTQVDMLQRAAVAGQLSAAGQQYSGELTRMTQQLDRVGQLDMLITDMDRLVAEGKELGLTNNPKMLNFLNQELANWTASGGTDKLSKGAEWYRAYDTLNARFATVAQAVEQITGNRLAVTQTTRALGYHPRMTDPHSVQTRVVAELREAARKQRELVGQNISMADAKFSRAAGGAGVPYILGGGHGGVESVEEEK